MNKFFYIFYIFPLFISTSLLAQEAVRKKAPKSTGRYVQLLEAEEDIGVVPPADFAALTIDYETQTIDQHAAQNAQTTSAQLSFLGAPTSSQTASTTYDLNFDPRANTHPTPTPLAVEQSVGNIATSSTLTEFNPYTTTQPIPTPPAVAQSIDSTQSTSTSITRGLFDPYAITQPTPTSPAVAQSIVSAQSTATSSTATPATSSTTQTSYIQDKQLDHTQYVEEPESKKKARIRLMVIMQTYYTTIEDRRCRSKIKDALKEQIKILRQEFPSETGIEEWFLNEAIDTKGNTMAHRAALNADVPLLEMLHEMGVDIFKQNNEKQTPQQVAEVFFIYRSPLPDAEKNALLVIPKPKKKKKQPVSTENTTITTVTPYTVEQLKAHEKYRKEQNDACRKTDQERYQRFQKLEAFYRQIKAKKK